YCDEAADRHALGCHGRRRARGRRRHAPSAASPTSRPRACGSRGVLDRWGVHVLAASPPHEGVRGRAVPTGRAWSVPSDEARQSNSSSVRPRSRSALYSLAQTSTRYRPSASSCLSHNWASSSLALEWVRWMSMSALPTRSAMALAPPTYTMAPPPSRLKTSSPSWMSLSCTYIRGSLG